MQTAIAGADHVDLSEISTDSAELTFAADRPISLRDGGTGSLCKIALSGGTESGISR